MTSWSSKIYKVVLSHRSSLFMFMILSLFPSGGLCDAWIFELSTTCCFSYCSVVLFTIFVNVILLHFRLLYYFSWHFSSLCFDGCFSLQIVSLQLSSCMSSFILFSIWIFILCQLSKIEPFRCIKKVAFDGFDLVWFFIYRLRVCILSGCYSVIYSSPVRFSGQRWQACNDFAAVFYVYY